jgi:protein CpxP
MKRCILIAMALIVLIPMVIWAESPATQPAQDTKGKCPAFDCGHGRGGPGPEFRLNLTEEQREKLKALREEFRSKFQEACKSGDKDKIKAVEDEFIEKAKTFLSEEQVEKLKARHEAAARMWKHRKNMGPQLNLTDEQKTKMKELRKKHQEEMKAMREKHQADMKAILTPEQVQKFEAWLKEKQEQMKDRSMGPCGPEGRFDRGRMGKGPGKHHDGMKGKGKGPCDKGSCDIPPTTCPAK